MLNTRIRYVKGGLVDQIERIITNYFNASNHFSIAYKYNNPGRLQVLEKPHRYKAIKTSNGLFFKERRDGYRCLRNKIKDAIERGWSLNDFIKYNKYPLQLNRTIATHLNIESHKLLSDYLR